MTVSADYGLSEPGHWTQAALGEDCPVRPRICATWIGSVGELTDESDVWDGATHPPQWNESRAFPFRGDCGTICPFSFCGMRHSSTGISQTACTAKESIRLCIKGEMTTPYFQETLQLLQTLRSLPVTGRTNVGYTCSDIWAQQNFLFPDTPLSLDDVCFLLTRGV